MESQPQIPEFRHNPENFHPCMFVEHFALGTDTRNTKVMVRSLLIGLSNASLSFL